ncbi:Uncharacterised protein [Paenibacillus polymyxa]|uniref:Uncharacterized protein n=1 Tax=Paenibacillus polymyxa TaxID=1406 RepID=A0A378Y0L4_PAEPO|nr:Uncharacterised protein [Paenibacillus polymyxa]
MLRKMALLIVATSFLFIVTLPVQTDGQHQNIVLYDQHGGA